MYGPDKVFSLGLGVLSGFVFQHCSPGDTTLSEPRDPSVVSSRLASYHYKLVHKLDSVCLGRHLSWFVRVALTAPNAPNESKNKREKTETNRKEAKRDPSLRLQYLGKGQQHNE